MSLARYIGIPYKNHGRGYDGSDCMGIVYLFYRDVLGLLIPSYDADYIDAQDRQSVMAAINKNVAQWHKLDEPEYGAVLIFNLLNLPVHFNLLNLPVHTGVYIGNGDFIHGLSGTDSCIERLDSITWKRRLKGIFRWQKN